MPLSSVWVRRPRSALSTCNSAGKVTFDCIPPVLVKFIIRYVQGSLQVDTWIGALLLAALFVCMIGESLCIQHFWHVTAATSNHVRPAFSSCSVLSNE